MPSPPPIRRDDEAPAVTGELASDFSTPYVPEFHPSDPRRRRGRRRDQDYHIESDLNSDLRLGAVTEPVSTRTSGGTVVTFPPQEPPGLAPGLATETGRVVPSTTLPGGRRRSGNRNRSRTEAEPAQPVEEARPTDEAWPTDDALPSDDVRQVEDGQPAPDLTALFDSQGADDGPTARTEGLVLFGDPGDDTFAMETTELPALPGPEVQPPAPLLPPLNQPAQPSSRGDDQDPEVAEAPGTTLPTPGPRRVVASQSTPSAEQVPIPPSVLRRFGAPEAVRDVEEDHSEDLGRPGPPPVPHIASAREISPPPPDAPPVVEPVPPAEPAFQSFDSLVDPVDPAVEPFEPVDPDFQPFDAMVERIEHVGPVELVEPTEPDFQPFDPVAEPFDPVVEPFEPVPAAAPTATPTSIPTPAWTEDDGPVSFFDPVPEPDPGPAPGSAAEVFGSETTVFPAVRTRRGDLIAGVEAGPGEGDGGSWFTHSAELPRIRVEDDLDEMMFLDGPRFGLGTKLVLGLLLIAVLAAAGFVAVDTLYPGFLR